MKEYRIEDYLTEGEEILFSGKPKENGHVTVNTIAMLPLMFLWLSIECVILGYSVSTKIFGDINTYYMIMTIAAIVLHIVPTAIWFVAIAKRNGDIGKEEYAVTNKNVIIMHGNLHHAVEIIPIKAIEEVGLTRSVSAKLFGVGTIVLMTEDERIYLYYLEDAIKSFRKIYGAIEGKEEPEQKKEGKEFIERAADEAEMEEKEQADSAVADGEEADEPEAEDGEETSQEEPEDGEEASEDKAEEAVEEGAEEERKEVGLGYIDELPEVEEEEKSE